MGVLSAQVFNFELQSHDLLDDAKDNSSSSVSVFNYNELFWSSKIMIGVKNNRCRQNLYVDINVKNKSNFLKYHIPEEKRYPREK